MKKVLRRIGIGLLVFVAILTLVLNYALGPIVEKGVVVGGPAVVGVPITLESARIRLLRGKVDLKGLIVGNPEGYKSEYAFRLGKFKIDMEPSSVLSDTIRIKEIVIDGPEIIYEMSVSGSNLGAILKGLESEDATEPKEQAPETGKAAEAKAVEIDRLIVSNGKIRLTSKLLQGNTITLPLPTIELKDIGKKDGEKASIADVVRSVIGAIIRSVTTVVTGSGKLLADGAGAALDLGAAGAGAAVDAAAAGAGAAVDGAKAVGGAVGKGAGKVISSVGGLFKHDSETEDAKE